MQHSRGLELSSDNSSCTNSVPFGICWFLSFSWFMEGLFPQHLGATQSWLLWSSHRDQMESCLLQSPVSDLSHVGAAAEHGRSSGLSQYVTALCLQTYPCLRHCSGFQFWRGFPSPGCSRCHSSLPVPPLSFLAFFHCPSSTTHSIPLLQCPSVLLSSHDRSWPE